MKIFERFGGKRITFEEFKMEWEQPYMNFGHKYLPHLTKKQNDETYVKEIMKLPTPKTFPGIKKALEQLKESGKNLILLSSDPTVSLQAELKRFNLKNMFNDIYNDIHDKRKAIKGIIEKQHYKPEETIFIGDTTHEVETGKKARIKTGGVSWGFQYEEKIKMAKPDYFFHQVSDLIKLLD